jgi:large subunit ribosomal protein L32
MKRSHNALTAQTLAKCPNCGHSVMPHRVCANCGHYKGKEVVKVNVPKTAKKKTA